MPEYEDWTETEPVHFSNKPVDGYDGEVYGFYGPGWYFVDMNGMLVGGPHKNKNDAEALGQHVAANRRQNL